MLSCRNHLAVAVRVHLPEGFLLLLRGHQHAERAPELPRRPVDLPAVEVAGAVRVEPLEDLADGERAADAEEPLLSLSDFYTSVLLFKLRFVWGVV